MKPHRSKRVAGTAALVTALLGQIAVTSVLADEGVPAAGGEAGQLATEQLYTLEGTITIIKPHGGTMFQMFHAGGQLWAFHLGMGGDGDIRFGRRREEPGKERNITIAENMVGKPLSIRIRTNAEDYEVYKKQPLVDEDWELVTDGSYRRGEGNRVQFRWGWYLGRNPPGRRVGNDAMYFVSGTTIRSVTKE